jgi:CoA transferase family III
MAQQPQPARAYAERLLQDVGLPRPVPLPPQAHPALRWARSGNMALTGAADGTARLCPVPLACFADGVLAALRAIGPATALPALDGAALLAERAALAGLARGGAVSAGGSCRLLAAQDGWLALNLPRASDWELLPAWLESGALGDWQAVAAALVRRPLQACIARGRLLGLAVAPLASPDEELVPWYRELWHCPPAAPRARGAAPLVIDLSSLWAGPLCTRLLQRFGARVIKVESRSRPDGLRTGSAAFYDLLNAGKASVALDFGAAAAHETLQMLLRRADIVVEASRPRALRQLGIRAEEVLAGNPGATWIAISGYGRDEPAANWIAFGDDAAVAAGLSQLLRVGAEAPIFCGDAIADPLAGLHAALAAWSSYLRGGGRLLSLALRDVVAHCIGCGRHAGDALPATGSVTMLDHAALQARSSEWGRHVTAPDVAPPRARYAQRPARVLGADNAAVLCELGARPHAGRVVSAAQRPASRPKKVASASDIPEL